MAVFAEDRLEAMRGALTELLATSKLARHARFVGQFSAGDDDGITISFADGSGQVVSGSTDTPDFVVSGPAEDWELFFTDRPVSHSSIIGMLGNASSSAGALPSPLEQSGDPLAFFSNLSLFSRIFESAAIRKGVK